MRPPQVDIKMRIIYDPTGGRTDGRPYLSSDFHLGGNCVNMIKQITLFFHMIRGGLDIRTKVYIFLRAFAPLRETINHSAWQPLNLFNQLIDIFIAKSAEGKGTLRIDSSLRLRIFANFAREKKTCLISYIC